MPESDKMTRRSGRNAAPAARAWNTLIDRVSPITTLPAGAPISRATRSPIERGQDIQPAVFQPRISSLPHSSERVRATRASAAMGKGPSELPSR